MVDEEKNLSRMSGYGWLYSLLGLIAPLLIAIYHARDTIGGLIAKMTSDIFNIVVIAILFLGVIMSFIRWNTQLLRNRLRKSEEETKQVKSKLEETTNQYDELFELTKLPLEDEIITIEPSTYQEVVKREVSIPCLQFKLNVHNHSYYHFTPKRVELKCSNSGKKVVEDEWDVEKDIGYISAKRYIHVGEQLPGYQPSSIIFEVPIEKRYDDWYDWGLKGYAIYTNGEEERKVKIDTPHQMYDKNIHKLEKLLEDALGEGEK